MATTLSESLAYLSLGLGAVGVTFAAIAQMMRIRNETDHFMNDLMRQGRWAMWASILQMLATAVLVVRIFLTGEA